MPEKYISTVRRTTRGGATNLYANTVSGGKKAGGIGGNILSINKGDSGIDDDPLGPGFEGDPEGDSGSDDDPLGPGFEGDPEGDSDSDPKSPGSGSDADTGKYYPYPIWGIWEGQKVTYVINIGQVVVIKAKNLRSFMGAAVFVAEMHAGSIEEQYGYLAPKGGTHEFHFYKSGDEPMDRNFTIYTLPGTDVKVFLSFWSTWGPGMKPNPPN